MDVIDLKQQLKSLYRAKAEPSEVVAPESAFLSIDGIGAPGSTSYVDAIQMLYGLAYTMKFMLKGAGTLDFKIPNVECLWSSDPVETPIDQWEWQLMIRVPDAITTDHVDKARQLLMEKKDLDATPIALIRWKEGTAVQALHLGPYETIADTYARIESFATKQGAKLRPVGHEVYLSDPRRTAPEKLKTIVRLSIQPN